MFSDQLATVISGLYGHDIAEVLCSPTSLLVIYTNVLLHSMQDFMSIINVSIIIRC